MEYNGQKYGQSSAIAAFFASEFGKWASCVLVCVGCVLANRYTYRVKDWRGGAVDKRAQPICTVP